MKIFARMLGLFLAAGLSAACPDPNDPSDLDGTCYFVGNSSVFSNGAGFGTLGWAGNAGAALVYVNDGNGPAVTGFVENGPRGEGRMTGDAALFVGGELYMSMTIQVFSGAAAVPMTVLEWAEGNRYLKVEVFGPGHALYNNLRYTWSTPAGLSTTTSALAYGSGPVNDANPGTPPVFGQGRWLFAVAINACGLRVIPRAPGDNSNLVPDPSGTSGISLAGYGDLPSPAAGAPFLCFGNDNSLGQPMDGYIDDFRIWHTSPGTPSASPSPTRTATPSPTATPTRTPASSCPDPSALQGAHYFNDNDLYGDEPGPGFGSPMGWSGNAGAAPVFNVDAGGKDLTGFVQNGPRGEGKLTGDAALFGNPDFYVSFIFTVHNAAAAVPFTIMEWAYGRRYLKIEAFGPGHAMHQQLRVSYSTAAGVQTAMLTAMHGTGLWNDVNPGNTSTIDPGRYMLAIAMNCCGLRIIPASAAGDQTNMNPDPSGSSGTVMAGYGELPSPFAGAPFLCFGNNHLLGQPLDGLFDDPRIFHSNSACSNPSPTLSPTRTPSPAVSTSTPSRTSSPTPSPTPPASSATPTAALTQAPTKAPTPKHPPKDDECSVSPNPVGSKGFKLGFKLPGPGEVRIRIWNARGDAVSEIRENMDQGGLQALQIGSANLAPGVYFYRVECRLADGRVHKFKTGKFLRALK